MIRLKSIAQYGVPDKWYHLKGYGRYEHCVGTMLLLKTLDVELKEQIAGLLHDVSHTAFSHVVDWVIGDEAKEDYQDKIHKEIILKSEIPDILNKYGFDAKEISELEKFTHLEQPIPFLCADRIDYTLRDALFDKKDLIISIVNSLTSFNNKIVFKDRTLAKIFGLEYLKCNQEHWGGIQAVIRYRIFGNVLKEALKKDIISEKDFLKTDDYVIKKIESSEDTNILSKLNSLLNLKFKEVTNNPDIEGKKKMRYIDPTILVNNKVCQLSEIDKEYLENINRYKEMNNKITQVKILK